MDTAHLTAILEQHLRAVSGGGTFAVRARPAAVARFFCVSLAQARAACRRLARRGVLVGGRLPAAEGR